MGPHMSRADADSVRDAKDQHTQEHLMLGGDARLSTTGRFRQLLPVSATEHGRKDLTHDTGRATLTRLGYLLTLRLRVISASQGNNGSIVCR